MRPRLLIVDDQRDVLTALRMALTKEGIEVVTAGSPAGALAAVATDSFDAALIDLNYTRDTTSGVEGLNLLEKLHQTEPLLPVVVMTAWASVDLAVQAMRTGARDFIAHCAVVSGSRLKMRFCVTPPRFRSWPNRLRCRRCCRSHNGWHPPMPRF
jgi:DNA-binding NtrC family response regulator